MVGLSFTESLGEEWASLGSLCHIMELFRSLGQIQQDANFFFLFWCPEPHTDQSVNNSSERTWAYIYLSHHLIHEVWQKIKRKKTLKEVENSLVLNCFFCCIAMLRNHLTSMQYSICNFFKFKQNTWKKRIKYYET